MPSATKDELALSGCLYEGDAMTDRWKLEGEPVVRGAGGWVRVAVGDAVHSPHGWAGIVLEVGDELHLVRWYTGPKAGQDRWWERRWLGKTTLH